LHENNTTNDTAQLLIIIPGIMGCFEVVEELAIHKSDKRLGSKYDLKGNRFSGGIRREMDKKSQILHGTLLQYPLTVAVWKNFDV